MFWQVIFGGIGAILNPIASIANKIADEKIALANAQTDKERIASEERIKSLQARHDVMVAEAGSGYGWINAAIRAMIAIGPTVYLLKIFIWDKVLQSLTHGSTDPLDSNLWQVVTAVVGFYFLYDISVGVTRILKR